jgi:hypothetical protein
MSPIIPYFTYIVLKLNWWLYYYLLTFHQTVKIDAKALIICKPRPRWLQIACNIPNRIIIASLYLYILKTFKFKIQTRNTRWTTSSLNPLNATNRGHALADTPAIPPLPTPKSYSPFFITAYENPLDCPFLSHCPLPVSLYPNQSLLCTLPINWDLQGPQRHRQFKSAPYSDLLPLPGTIITHVLYIPMNIMWNLFKTINTFVATCQPKIKHEWSRIKHVI